MPRFKGSCGCYNREDARTIGLVPAIVWNDMLDRAEHFEMNPMWYDQKDAADRLGMSETSLKRAVDKLVEAGRITKRKGYRPGTTVSTTWITISENVKDDTSRKSDLTLPRKSDLAVPILKETKQRDSSGGNANDEDSGDMIPLAAVTTHHVEITVYDSDDSGKCINVKHQVSPRDWNKAVKKWRKDPAERVMMEFKDTGESERMTFNRIKKYNVRPQQQSLGYDRNEGTAFRINL